MDVGNRTSRGEDGVARVRRDMARAERRHRQHRGYAITTGAALAVVLVLATLVTVARALTSPAAAQPVVPKPVAPVSAPVAPAAEPTAAAVPDQKPRPSARPKPISRPVVASAQRFRIRIGDLGYEPSTVAARAGAPIVLTVDRGEGCAAGFYMPALGVKGDNSNGPITLRLGRVRAGAYRFTCGMGMVEGKLVVR